MEINGFEIEKYNQHGFKDRAKTDICPFCSADRKKKNDKTARPNAILDNPVCLANRNRNTFTPVPIPIKR